MTQLYTCTGCQKTLPRSEFHEYNRDVLRPVTSKCRHCRRLDRLSKLYTTKCGCCLEPKPLDSNNICKKCNENSGLRECSVCHKILPLYLCFTQRQTTCKECKKQNPKLNQ